jgi:hypothetical protein
MEGVLDNLRPEFNTMLTLLYAMEDPRASLVYSMFFFWALYSNVIKQRQLHQQVSLIGCLLSAIISTGVVRVLIAFFCPQPVRLGAPAFIVLLDAVLLLASPGCQTVLHGKTK